ncbi:hypothetical protein Avbf_08265 [Armadillidium vulgare]|nr:hypothetical protein Avbf_08265 [Armadillidium vulgare]
MKMLFQSAGVALLVLIVPSMAALGPPPGSRGVIDFRYPDYIVDPRPPCLSEGVFPHPRNCSWYYSCHDVYGIGYYRQHYFECEPGTVFSDELDQCIHPFNPKYPCLTEVLDCYDSMIKCKVYLCPNSNTIMRYIGRLCESAIYTCKNGTEINYCNEAQYFDVLTRTCVQNPVNRGCIEIPEEAPSTTTEQVTTAIAVDPSLLTFTFTVTCSVELCLKYLQCVRADNEWKAIVMECPPGLFFSYENDICTTKPEGGCPFERTNRIFNF